MLADIEFEDEGFHKTVEIGDNAKKGWSKQFFDLIGWFAGCLEIKLGKLDRNREISSWVSKGAKEV